MTKAKALVLKTTPHLMLVSKLHHAGLMLGEFMYGTKQRSWITLAIAFGMLILGIEMMQTAANGGFCSVQG